MHRFLVMALYFIFFSQRDIWLIREPRSNLRFVFFTVSPKVLGKVVVVVVGFGQNKNLLWECNHWTKVRLRRDYVSRSSDSISEGVFFTVPAKVLGKVVVVVGSGQNKNLLWECDHWTKVRLWHGNSYYFGDKLF